jgi:transposase
MVNPNLPQPDTLRCRQIKVEPDEVTIVVESLLPRGLCPLCGCPSFREHSRYTRRLGDVPWQGQSVCLLLLARRLFCDSPTCPRRIFTARLPGVASV